jgi:ATP-dependent exoDNAse (exonuclease V) beta subunit
MEPETTAATPLTYSRLASQWHCPPAPENIRAIEVKAVPEAPAVEFDWAGEMACAVGVVAHRLLQRLGLSGLAPDTKVNMEAYGPAARQMLLREGVVPEQLSEALSRVMQALNNMLSDKRGRWILSDQHQDIGCEYPLAAVIDGKIRRMVIDRTFVDQEGNRWIIDYKTGSHEGGDPKAFLEREKERYRTQLEDYAQAFKKLEQRPIRLGLYYPVLKGWQEL